YRTRLLARSGPNSACVHGRSRRSDDTDFQNRRAGLPRSLTAYVEPKRGVDELVPRDLVAALEKRLPGYMIPARFVVLDTLPRLSNLKIDHVALSRIDAEQSASATDLIADPLTAEVARIFERALGTTGATPDDNVASLGGDSLHAVSVIVALESRFQMAIPLE